MKIVYITFAVGFITAVLVLLSTLVRTKFSDRPQQGIAALILIAVYSLGHILLNGIPPLFQRGFNIPTDQWNLIIAVTAFIPVVVAEYSIKNESGKYILRFIYTAAFVSMILFIPFIKTNWVIWESIIVISVIGSISVFLWKETDSIPDKYINSISFSLMLSQSLSVLAVLGLSNTMSLSVLSAQVFASAAAIAVALPVLKKLGLETGHLINREIPGFIYLMSVIFIIQGYFFAYVPLASVILLFFPLFIFGISNKVLSGRSSFNEKKTARNSTILCVVLNISAIIVAGAVNI